MTTHDITFIEKFSIFGMKSGLPRSTAAVLGYLLICTPSEQSAAMIRKQLDLSLGSVSNALGTLTLIGVITQTTLPNKRSIYYKLDPAGILHSVQLRFASLTEAQTIASEGLVASPHNKRLLALQLIYAIFQSDLAKTVRKLEKSIAQYENS